MNSKTITAIQWLLPIVTVIAGFSYFGAITPLSTDAAGKYLFPGYGLLAFSALIFIAAGAQFALLFTANYVKKNPASQTGVPLGVVVSGIAGIALLLPYIVYYFSPPVKVSALDDFALLYGLIALVSLMYASGALGYFFVKYYMDKTYKADWEKRLHEYAVAQLDGQLRLLPVVGDKHTQLMAMARKMDSSRIFLITNSLACMKHVSDENFLGTLLK